MNGNPDYEMSEYAIALQRAIEAHCRGRMADETDGGGCPWHAKMLNRYLTRSADVTDAVVDAAHDAFFADYKNHPRGEWKDFLRTALATVWPLPPNTRNQPGKPR